MADKKNHGLHKLVPTTAEDEFHSSVMHLRAASYMIGGFFFLVALVFVYRSFYGMRIPEDK